MNGELALTGPKTNLSVNQTACISFRSTNVIMYVLALHPTQHLSFTSL